MKLFLPAVMELFQKLIDDNSAVSALLQKQLLKILYALVQVMIVIEQNLLRVLLSVIFAEPVQ